jgi:nucleoside-diphosphate-sugar epimerase
VRDYLNIHARSKADAEQLVMDDDRDAGTVILRPHAVYGPGDTMLLPRIEKAVKLGRLMLPNGGRSLNSLTRIDNLVGVILEMIEVDVLEHRIFNVADGDVVTLRCAVQSILGSRGKKVSILGLPPDLAWNLGKATEWFYREMESGKTPALTRYLASQLGYEQTLDLTRIENQLGRKMPHSDFSDAASWDKPLVPA